MRSRSEIRQIARNILRHPPGPRDMENGALQEEIADLCHWVVAETDVDEITEMAAKV